MVGEFGLSQDVTAILSTYLQYEISSREVEVVLKILNRTIGLVQDLIHL